MRGYPRHAGRRKGSWRVIPAYAGVGLGLPMTMAMAALIVLVIPQEHIWDFLLLPLPTVLLPGVVWALLLYGIQHAAKRLRKKRIWGPLAESLLMVLMFVPVIVLAVLVTAEFKLDDRWSSVLTILLGILFGSVVSVPLSQFLLDLGNLPPDPRWEGTDNER